MNRKFTFLTFVLAFFTLNSSMEARAEFIQCMSKYKASSKMSGESPGMLSTRKDTPCRLSRRIKGSGTAGGIQIVEQPKNGRLTVENISSLIYTPKSGFSGSDVALVKMLYRSGKSEGGLVRFSISVQ